MLTHSSEEQAEGEVDLQKEASEPWRQDSVFSLLTYPSLHIAFTVIFLNHGAAQSSFMSPMPSELTPVYLASLDTLSSPLSPTPSPP